MTEPMFVNLTGVPIHIYRRLVFVDGAKPADLLLEIPPNGHVVAVKVSQEDLSLGEGKTTAPIKRSVLEGLPPAEPYKGYKFYIVPAEVGPFVPNDRQDVLWPSHSRLTDALSEEGGDRVIYATCLEGHGKNA